MSVPARRQHWRMLRQPAGDAPVAASVAPDRFCADVLAGLAAPVRQLPPKYFYDDTGARLFEAICTLPEYYPTRTELWILEQHAADIAARIGGGARVVEFGSGSGIKTRILLRSLTAPSAYVAIDIAGAQLERFAAELRSEFPSLDVRPVAADYTAAVQLPPAPADAGRTVAFFPGSTIGNFEEADAVAFLRRVRRVCGADGALLIGADLHKDSATLERAYNDPQGVTAAFNLNLLARINRECGADFPLDAFVHRALYDEHRQRIEMRLVCVRPCRISIPTAAEASGAQTFIFDSGSCIVTEYSHKYTRDSFTRLAALGGWKVDRCWTDPLDHFSVWLLT